MLQAFLKILSNPKVVKIIGIIAIFLLLFWVLSNSSSFAQKMVKKILPPKGENLYKSISESRKVFIEDLMDAIHSDIYGFTTNETESRDFERLLALPDNEFLYGVKYYNKAFTGKGLYYDVDWEVMPFNSSDDDLLARLEKMNLV